MSISYHVFNVSLSTIGLCSGGNSEEQLLDSSMYYAKSGMNHDKKTACIICNFLKNSIFVQNGTFHGKNEKKKSYVFA